MAEAAAAHEAYYDEMVVMDYYKNQDAIISTFGLKQITMEDVPVFEMPNISFNFDVDHVMQWLADVEAEATALHEASYESMMELGTDVQTALESAEVRQGDLASTEYDMVSRVVFDSMNMIFDTIAIDGVTAGDMWPEPRAVAVSDALEAVREGYEEMGFDFEASQNELDARAVVDTFEAARMEEMEFHSMVETTQSNDLNMIPYALGGAALLAGGLYFFSRKSEAKSYNSAFLSQ